MSGMCISIITVRKPYNLVIYNFCQVVIQSIDLEKIIYHPHLSQF